jgi:hypothetical protein
MSGRIRNDASATFLRPRFLIPAIVVIAVLAVIIWFLRGRP